MVLASRRPVDTTPAYPMLSGRNFFRSVCASQLVDGLMLPDFMAHAWAR